jgi:hypothetical protein
MREPPKVGDAGIGIKQYRKAKDENAKLRRATQLQAITIAALQAGVPTETPAARSFIKQYDGPLDADSVHGAAVAFGVWGAEGRSVITTAPGVQPGLDPQAAIADMRDVLARSGLPEEGALSD